MNRLPKLLKSSGSLPLTLFAIGTGVFFIGSSSLYNVEGGQRAIIFNRVGGLSRKIYGEGTHFRIPYFQRPIIYSIRTKPTTVSSLTGSKDLQMVRLNIRILYRPVETELPIIYETLGLDYDDRVLPSIANEVLKSVVAKFDAAQLITQRQLVSSQIKQLLMERARDFHITLDDVAIIDLSFGKEFSSAVEAKQVAQTEADRARFIVDKARQEKLGIIVKAEGEAKAAKMISDAIRDNPNFLKLRQLEAAREIAEIVAKGKNRVFLDADALLLSTNFDEQDGKKN